MVGLRWLIALPLAVVTTTAVFACNLGIGYPEKVTTPEAIALVVSLTTDPDLTAHVVLANGQNLVVGRSDRTLGGLGGPGDLQFAGSQLGAWYLAGHRSEKPSCYWIGASRAYSEPESVVLAFEDWPGVGVRLAKAPNYDDSKLVVTDSQGRLRYSSIGTISLCSDVEGRISGLR